MAHTQETQMKKIAVVLFKSAEQNVKSGNISAARAYYGRTKEIMRETGIVKLSGIKQERFNALCDRLS